MWREIDIKAMQSFEFLSPSLDFGCGDGIFSFIRAGGEFDERFDAFRTIVGLDKYFNNVDVFDAYDESSSALVTKPPEYHIDCGFDHKENLLKKAGKLGFYRDLQKGDANQRLPFADKSFRSVFSNIVYWLDDPQAVLTEIARILKPGGRACFMLPNESLPTFSFYKALFLDTKDPKWSFLEKLDRGRFSDNIRQSRSASQWEAVFDLAKLSVVEHKTHLSKSSIQIWDIGLRPLFPVLLKMTEAMDTEKSAEIKKEWVETIRQFLQPIILMDGQLNKNIEPAFHCYIVEK